MLERKWFDSDRVKMTKISIYFSTWNGSTPERQHDEILKYQKRKKIGHITSLHHTITTVA
jgi:hypothetical protein